MSEPPEGGLPASQLELDSSRAALAFYCLGTLDLLGRVNTVRKEARDEWVSSIWELQTSGPSGTGFKPSLYMTSADAANRSYSEGDAPHLIMTYTALLSLAILRDDFSRLDRPGLLKFLRACQKADGSFSTIPFSADSDLRLSYCAFAISSMLDDWSGMDVGRAIGFIQHCRSYEGGYGQEPFGEALGGTTYCALAALRLATSGASSISPSPLLTPTERRQTIRWLMQNQDAASGGFAGRTNKIADACYCFWCGAALEILGAGELVDVHRHAAFLDSCQFKFGGIAKAPGEHPDPYHTYLSLAALSIFPVPENDPGFDATFRLEPLDTLLNANMETARWARRHIPAERVNATVA